MADYIRNRNATIAVKSETTSGVNIFDGAPPNVATDFLKAEVGIQFNQQTIQNTEYTGSLDAAPSIPGGTRASLTVTCVMRGSGNPATPPRWGKLLKACTFEELVVAAGSSVTIDSTGARTAVLPNTQSSVEQAYRGAPVVFNAAGPNPQVSTVTNYVGSTRTLQSLQAFDPPLTDTDTFAVLPHVLYRPVSNFSDAGTVSIAFYRDGLLYSFAGCAGTFEITLNTAGIAQIVFTMQGKFLGATAVPIPTGLTTDDIQPPVFRDNLCRINGLLARVSRLTLTGGVTLFEPENPEAPEGYDAAIATGRTITGSADPLSTVAGTIAVLNDFRNGVTQTLGAVIGKVPGNRVGFTVPAAQYSGASPSDRSGLAADALQFGATGSNSGLYIAAF